MTFAYPSGAGPTFEVQQRQYFRLQGLERLPIGASHLNFASSSPGLSLKLAGTSLRPGEWLGGGTFRNSFYLEPWSQLTSVRDLNLAVDFAGTLRIRLMYAVRGEAAKVQFESVVHQARRGWFVEPIGSPSDMPEGARLFWHVEADAPGASVYDVQYVTRSLPRQDCRLAVLLRTYGRTSEIQALLKRFADQAEQDPHHAEILQRIHFWLLDTTPGCESQYEQPWQQQLNLHVLVGPNLGGGGNAGHLLRLFRDACEQTATPPTEVLLLDDDLSLSMESLARYYMFVAYRSSDALVSLPVLMKSRPTVVWEDGGFWGRLNFHENGDFSRRRNLFPNLLKHGLDLGGFDHLDDFGTLNACEYSTFIFFGLSMKALDRIGYPAAFFLRGDDIEMSLRAQELGLQMITNPNLAAWHEPAHSYAQEYMAILHGIIINLTYGEFGAEFYARYFEERMHEHASIDDGVGLRLYLDILEELLDPDSAVLTPGFASHYVAKLKELSRVRMTRLPEADRHALEQRAREHRALVVPFVYPGYHAQARRSAQVVLVNHPLRTYREVQPCALADKMEMIARFVELIQQLDAGFDEVRERWTERLKVASSPEFWTVVRDRSAEQTRVLYSGSASSVAQAAIDKARSASGSASSSANVLPFEREEESAALPALRSMDVGVIASASLPLDELPHDFDPDFYLAINADVATSGFDPVQHFLRFGRAEGRKYRL